MDMPKNNLFGIKYLHDMMGSKMWTVFELFRIFGPLQVKLYNVPVLDDESDHFHL